MILYVVVYMRGSYVPKWCKAYKSMKNAKVCMNKIIKKIDESALLDIDSEDEIYWDSDNYPNVKSQIIYVNKVEIEGNVDYIYAITSTYIDTDMSEPASLLGVKTTIGRAEEYLRERVEGFSDYELDSHKGNRIQYATENHSNMNIILIMGTRVRE